MPSKDPLETHFRTGYVAIVGRPNVGKSTLLNHLIAQKISITSSKAQTTRYRIHGILTDKNTQFIFVDTPGFQTRYRNRMNDAMNRVVAQSMQEVDAILFVVEALRFDELDERVLKLLPEATPVILAINKIDRLSDKTQLLPFLDKMADRYKFSAMIPVSATSKLQLPALLDAVRPYLPEIPPLYDADQITDKNERFIAAEMIREKMFRLLGDEIPYSTSVIIERFDETGKICKIDATILLDKSGQKAIVIGKKAEKLKLIATQARQDMEKLFDKKIFLRTWVKVRSGWADNVNVLKTLGHE